MNTSEKLKNHSAGELLTTLGHETCGELSQVDIGVIGKNNTMQKENVIQ